MALVAALALLVGCSGGGSSDEGESGTAPLTEETFASTVMAAMAEAGTVQVTTRNPASVLSGNVRFGDDYAMRLTSGTGHDRMEVVVVDGTSYVRAGVQKFVEAGDEEVHVLLGAPGAVLLTDLLGHPDTEFERFRDAGTETINDVEFHRYEVVFSRDLVDAAFRSGEKRMPRMNFRFWVDDDHRVRRMLHQIDGDEYVSDFVDWGTQAVIEPPVASEVVATGDYAPLTKDTFADATAAAFEGRTTSRMSAVYGPGFEMHGDVVTQGESVVAMDATVIEDGEAVEMRYVDRTCYLRLVGEPMWVQLTGADAEEVIADLEGPVAMGEQFRVGIGALAYLGIDEIDGKPFRRYKLSMTREWVAQQTGVHVTKVPDLVYDVHLDDQNRWRRLAFRAGGETVSMDLTRWGREVAIEAPPMHLVDGLDGA